MGNYVSDNESENLLSLEEYEKDVTPLREWYEGTAEEKLECFACAFPREQWDPNNDSLPIRYSLLERDFF